MILSIAVHLFLALSISFSPVHSFLTIPPGISSAGYLYHCSRGEREWLGVLSAKSIRHTSKGVQSPKARKRLRRIVNDLAVFELSGETGEKWIVKAVGELSLAKQDTERQRIAHWLAHRADFQKYPKYCELAIQVMALSGQIDSALSLFDMKTATNETTFSALVEGMRDAKRIIDLKDFLKQWGSTTCIIQLSVQVLNAFLSAQASFDDMHNELRRANEAYGVEPNAISYSILLHQAAKTGNRPMVNQVWADMGRANVAPVIECYNALLRMAETPKEVLFLWDTKITLTEKIRPDAYTIDYILCPMVKSGRMDEVMRILDEFVATSHPYTVTNAFTPFLLKLARDEGELDAARMIWDTYTFYGRLTPNIRHFNVLLGGYSSVIKAKDSANSGDADKAYEEGWDLYRTIALTQPPIRPDVITLVEMMSLCRSSDELSNLLYASIADSQFRLTGALFRSASKYVYSYLSDFSLLTTVQLRSTESSATRLVHFISLIRNRPIA